MKKLLIQLLQWTNAILVAVLIMNCLLYFYNRTTGWIDRDSGATLSIYKPNSSFLRSTEGRGFHKTDSRGYVNDVDRLADDYVIAVGASYTQGKEVESGERYTDLLNEWLGYTDEAYVYNVSQDGYFFPDIVRGFTPLVGEFPDASKIIIEIGTTEFSVDALQNALIQRSYDESQNGNNILSNISYSKKISMAIKEYSPLFYNINEKIKNIKELNTDDSDTKIKEVSFDKDEYKASLEDDFDLMTSLYDGDLIIIYHPTVEIDDNGMSVVEKETDAIFQKVCDEYGVAFLDTSERFIKGYKDNNEVPYGFSNTSMGNGHFNKCGHRMMAEELLEVLKQREN